VNAEPPTEEQIRFEIAAEQEQLADAFAAFRRDLDEKRPALRVLVGVGAVAGVAWIAGRARRRRD
jgi:hypothetical protein